MSSILLSGPAVEPLSLDDAKSHLRVAAGDDDELIAALISGARVHVESQMRRALITQSWRLIRDVWPEDGRVAVVPVPLRTLDAARIYRLDGTTQTVDVSAFAADVGAAPAVLSFRPGTLPAPDRVAAGIELDVTLGYGDSAQDVPQPLRQAIRLLVAHWYENRAIVAVGQQMNTLPATVSALLSPYRVLSL